MPGPVRPTTSPSTLTVASLTGDRRMAPLVLAMVVSAVGTAFLKAHALEVCGTTMGLGCIAVGMLWLRAAASTDATMDA